MQIFVENFVDPNEPRSLYCDMDGVLVDFYAGLMKVYPDIKNVREVEQFLSRPNAWAEIGNEHPHLFRTLLKLEGADELMDVLLTLRDRKKIKLNILTAIPGEHVMPFAREDKKAWIQQYYPQIPPKNVFVVKRSQKQNFARVMEPEPPAVLIDDFKKNITEWHSAGGLGIQHRDTPSTLRKLKTALRTFSIRYL